MKITKQRLKEIIAEEIQGLPEWTKDEVSTILRQGEQDKGPQKRSEPTNEPVALQYVRNSPEEAGKMLQDLLKGITLIKQQASELSARFNQLKPGDRDRAVHGLQEVKTILEGMQR